MKLAILHYHLNRGGVTRVVANHLQALDQTVDSRCEVAILFDGQTQGWPADLGDAFRHVRLQLVPVPELAYQETPRPAPGGLTRAIRSALRSRAFHPDSTLLHVHNHSLGKSVSLPGTLSRLAECGYPLLLQIHDFAEDFRPFNFSLLRDAFGDEIGRHLYPQASHIHYATLNRRDHDLLCSAGVASDRVHFLPNPVPAPQQLPDRQAARQAADSALQLAAGRRYLLYPVRGIRRKNLGEALLWSALTPLETTVGITLAPLNVREHAQYDAWKDFARERQLPCRFEAGAALTLEQNQAAADGILSTSVTEGFGMVFLEAWLAQRPMAGRDLPEITADFREAGVSFPDLSPRVNVPLEWIGPVFEDRLRTQCSALLAAYGLPEPGPAVWDAAVADKLQGNCIDFGDLDEPLQQRVLSRILDDPQARTQLRELNPVFATTFQESRAVENENRNRIMEHYALVPSGQRLVRLYEHVRASAASPAAAADIDEQVILERFLSPARFRLLRSL